jgi:TM2 domain-containing membrane protein YozV
MSAAICPYCRAPLVDGENNEMLCPGCSTPHHTDCFTENGGCTVFGCSAAPPEEPKLRLTGSEIAASGVTAGSAGDAFTGTVPPGQALPAGTSIAPSAVPPSRVKAPPPPLPGVVAQPTPLPVPRFGAGSVLFGSQPVAAVATAPPAAPLSFEPDPDAKNRMTFIILGVLLGAFGAHNFYAGYTKKAVGQLCLTAFSVGFASPMSWVWAVIDVSTVDRDANGIKFRS